MSKIRVAIQKLVARFKSSLLFASATFLVQGINAITLPIFTRLLSQADYGILSVTNSVQNFATASFRLGTHHAVLKQYTNYTAKERHQYFFSVLVFSFLWSIILIGLFSCFTYIFNLKFFEKVTFYPYLLISLFIAGFSTSYAIFQSQLRLLKLSKTFIALSVFYVIASVLLSIILIVGFDMGAIGKLLGNLVPYLFIFGYLIIKKKAHVNIRYWIDAIKFGAPLSLSSVIISILMIYTIAYLSYQVSLSELGVYQIGRNLGLFIPQFLFQAITLTYVPFIYRKLNTKEINAITKINTVIIIGFCGLITLGILLSRFVVLVFATKEYEAAIPLLQVFFFSFIFKIIGYLPMIALFNKNKTKLVSLIEISTGVVFLGVIHWLVPMFGILGIAYAFLIQDFLKMVVIILISDLKFKQICSISSLQINFIKKKDEIS